MDMSMNMFVQMHSNNHYCMNYVRFEHPDCTFVADVCM